jgi:uncharacterized cupredoxin-like copper-binding protein
MPRHLTIAIISVVALIAFSTACDGGSGSDGATVSVSLKDFDLTVSPDSVAPGEVTFEASNSGPSTHEFEIFSGAADVDLDALPIENDVADTAGLTLVDELEDVTPDATIELAVTLEPGTYAIVCNLPEHFAKGMHDTLTVA